ncbi:tripartite tricarboxylate transporter TctA [Phocicoccus schoeneichii]|uniref:Tripartite tricarboxylate transporter TctA family protein n=1 Tax=Phocicoccus schoeneichii TaxID=1812261 RepID=A0A6V7R969_9BACL|nr:tripartite tricarboxylate transporter permease [Jeotgalicoccus schoeneichii]GGH53297.1 tripartite tricarboxylate transporter TctA [Jeotgalicoccus schoeneichii]CAD2073826.1 Tripartite tricarboxylate transporter TctA family protein [Jeotgalicoccus schoeneichii]
MGVDWGSFAEGFSTAIQFENLIFIVIGGLLGTIVGMLPGLGPATAVAVLIPVTFGMEPTSALILLGAIYYGAMYGGSRSSILINTPGDGSAIAATFDGYPMTRKGQAGQALTLATLASLVGGFIAMIGFVFLAQPLAQFALKFGPAEYFFLLLFTLSAVVSLSKGNMLKGFISMFLGLLITTIGIDSQSGVYRFTFGVPHLSEGVDFLVVIIGIYAVGEVLYNILLLKDDSYRIKEDVGNKWITKEQFKRSFWPALRQSPVGFLIGILPGAGGSIASMISYSTEQQLSKKSDEFGKGAPEGLAAPESSNNAAAVGAFIPLLTMGIPGSGTTAVILGALIMLGLQPGPMLFQNQPEVVWTFVNSLFIGNIALVIMNILLIGFLIKILKTPANILYPIILLLAFIGTYTLGYSTIDFFILMIFGVIGLFMKILNIPSAPLILAVIIGNQLEQNFRMASVSYDSVFGMMTASPIAIFFVIITVLSVFLPMLLNRLARIKR